MGISVSLIPTGGGAVLTLAVTATTAAVAGAATLLLAWRAVAG